MSALPTADESTRSTKLPAAIWSGPVSLESRLPLCLFPSVVVNAYYYISLASRAHLYADPVTKQASLAGNAANSANNLPYYRQYHQHISMIYYPPRQPPE
jgi:hypothetical protein